MDSFKPDESPQDSFKADDSFKPLNTADESALQTAPPNKLTQQQRTQRVGEALTAPGRELGAGFLGIENLPGGLQYAASKVQEAEQPGFKPQSIDEKLAMGAGQFGQMAGETVALGAMVPNMAAAFGINAGGGLAARATARVLQDSAVFGTQNLVDTASRKAAETGFAPTAIEGLKAAGKGALFGAGAGVAGTLPEAIALPQSLASPLKDAIFARAVGAGAFGTLGSIAAIADGAKGEDAAKQGAVYAALAFLNHQANDPAAIWALKGDLVKDVTDAHIQSGVDPAEAEYKARLTLEIMQGEQGHAQAWLKTTPEFQKATERMGQELLKVDPTLSPQQVELLAKAEMDKMFAQGAPTMADLKRMKPLKMEAEKAPEAGAMTKAEEPAPTGPQPIQPPSAPEAKEEADRKEAARPPSGPGVPEWMGRGWEVDPESLKEIPVEFDKEGRPTKFENRPKAYRRIPPTEVPAGGPQMTAPPEGTIPPPQPPAPEPSKPAAQPAEGDRVIMPTEGGQVEGRVVGYHEETGDPLVHVDAARGEHPAAEVGETIPVPPEALTNAGPMFSSTVEGPSSNIARLTPDQFKQRFPGADEKLYIAAVQKSLEQGGHVTEEAMAKYPDIKNAALLAQKRVDPEQIEAALSNVDVIGELRARRAVDIDMAKKSGDYADLGGKDVVRHGFMRRGGGIPGFDVAAQELHASGILPDADVETLKEAILSQIRRKSTKQDLQGYESNAGNVYYESPKPTENWLPERLKAAQDAAGLKPGGDLTSKGFIDPIHGRIGRGTKGQLIATDLENGKMLAQFGDRTSIVDPRDIRETYQADQKAIKETPQAPTKKGVEEATGVREADPRIVTLAESEALRIKLYNQQKGSLRGEQVGRRKALAEVYKNMNDVQAAQRAIIAFQKAALSGLKLTPTESGKLSGSVIKMKASPSRKDYVMQAYLTTEEVMESAYGRALDSEIKKVWGRSIDSKGVESGFRQRIQEARSDISWTRFGDAKQQAIADAMEFVAHANATGKAASIPPSIRELADQGGQRPLASLSIPEREELLDTMLALEHSGRAAQDHKELALQFRIERNSQLLTDAVHPYKDEPPPDPTFGAPAVGPLANLRNTIGQKMAFGQSLRRYISAPWAFLDTADGGMGGQGAHVQIIYKRLGRLRRDSDNHADQILDPIRNLISKNNLTPEEYERAALVLIREQFGGLKHLSGDGFLGATPEARKAAASSIKLTPGERALGESLLKAGNDQDLFNMIASTAKLLDNRTVVKLPSWYPFVSNYSKWENQEISDRVYSSYDNKYANTKVAEGHTLERIGGKTPLRYDFPAFERTIYDLCYYAHAATELRIISKALNKEAYARKAGQLMTTQVRDYMNVMVRRGGVEGARRWDALRNMMRGISIFDLSGRVWSAMAHLGMPALAIPDIGIGNVIYGMANSGGDKFEFMKANLPELRHSLRDMRRLEGGATTGMRSYDAARQVGAGGTAIGAYRDWFLRRGQAPDWTTPNKEAMDYAAEKMVKATSSPSYGDLPLMLSAGKFSGNIDISRAVAQFKMPGITMLGWFMHEFIDLGLNKGDWTHSAAALMSFAAALLVSFGIKESGKQAYKAILGGVFGETNKPKDEPIWERFALDVGNSMPFLSNLMAMAHRDYKGNASPRTGVAAVDNIVAAGESIGSAVYAERAQKTASALHATVSALSALAAMKGLPYGSLVSQAVQKAISAENPKPAVRPPSPPKPGKYR